MAGTVYCGAVSKHTKRSKTVLRFSLSRSRWSNNTVWVRIALHSPIPPVSEPKELAFPGPSCVFRQRVFENAVRLERRTSRKSHDPGVSLGHVTSLRLSRRSGTSCPHPAQHPVRTARHFGQTTIYRGRRQTARVRPRMPRKNCRSYALGTKSVRNFISLTKSVQGGRV